jgi:hypothetical protein
MSDSTETSAAILTRLFQDSDAPLGQGWLDSVDHGWTEASLHHLVVTSGTHMRAAEVRELYGHFRTKTQMKGIPGVYWKKEDQVQAASEELVRLNPTPMEAEKRLMQLRTDSVGGILLVTTVLEADGQPSGPFITILAAPSMATHTPPISDNGILYDDVWDATVLEPFKPALTTEDPHCPVMGAQEGKTRAAKLKPGMFHLLQETQPLLIPEGELIATTLTYEEMIYPRTIFLPEVCNLPFGMRWPVTIGYDDFKCSIQGAFGTAGSTFIKILKSMEVLLDRWFMAVAVHTAGFSIPSCPFLPFYDDHYPAIDTGEWPITVLDQEGFSPLLDMMNGYLWRIWCDRMLTTELPGNRSFLNQYLLIGDTVQKQDTYLGANIPSRFCPNFAHHFKVTNGWPTDTASKTFLKEFLHLPLISYQARQHDPVEVDLHQPGLTLDVFQTREAKMSAKHKSRTPKVTEVRKLGTLARDHSREGRAQKPPPHDSPKRLGIPSTIKKFSPAPYSPRRFSRNEVIPTQRKLEDELMEDNGHASTVTSLASKVSSIFHPMTGTIYTADGRAQATEVFMTVCRLLAHHSTRFPLTVGNESLPMDAMIFVREPCGLFRREILTHSAQITRTSGFMPSFLSFVEAILGPAQIQVSGVYDPKFFSGAFLYAFLTVESWMVSDQIQPASVPPATFHVYSLVSCLQKFAGHPLLLPAVGLSLLEAKQIGMLTYYLFAMMDLTDDGKFSDAKFAGSLLGQRLKAWSTLPDSATIHSLWNKAPLQTTYQWFASLQSILSTVQKWIKRLRYHPEQGFFHARDADGRRHLMLDNKIMSNIPGRTDSVTAVLQHYDSNFETRWFCGSFLDPMWTVPIPLGHSVVPIAVKKHPIPVTRDDAPDYGTQKRARLGGKKLTAPDFISQTPLMETVIPLPPNTRSTTMAMVKRINAPIQFPRLPSDNGTLQTICLSSAFQQPYNCCILRLCGDKKVVPRTPRLHIDLYKEPWRSKPESYWAPMVIFLQNEHVVPHIRPSAALKLATPNTQWT